MELVKFNAMKNAVAECHSIDEIANIRDKAEAYRYAMVQAKESPEIIKKASEIKLRSERRAGQILLEIPKDKGGDPSLYNKDSRPFQLERGVQNLKDLGITYKQSHQWQKIAKMPEDTFEEYIEEEKDITTSGIIRVAKITEKLATVEAKEKEYQEQVTKENDFDIDIYNTDKKFDIIYADPAWDYGVGDRSPSMHYKTIPMDEIKQIPVNKISSDNSILFIWVTFPYLKEGIEVMEEWGFRYITCGFNWVKRNKGGEGFFWGLGNWTRSNSELCLIGTKGTPTRINNSVHQILDDPLTVHSAKPKRVRSLITQLVGELPRIELFSRNEDLDGWYNWGNKI